MCWYLPFLIFSGFTILQKWTETYSINDPGQANVTVIVCDRFSLSNGFVRSLLSGWKSNRIKLIAGVR
jgi:hypothetical protein